MSLRTVLFFDLVVIAARNEDLCARVQRIMRPARFPGKAVTRSREVFVIAREDPTGVSMSIAKSAVPVQEPWQGIRSAAAINRTSTKPPENDRCL
jgi:hypothetical protein